MMKREAGATMVEYLLMVALIAIALVALVVMYQVALSDNMSESVECVRSIGDGGGADDCP